MLRSELVSLCLHSKLYSSPHHPIRLLHHRFRKASLIPNVLCFSNDVLLLIPQIGCCSQWPAHIQFAWSFKQHQTFSLLDPSNKHHGFLPPPWRQGDRWLESFESWGLNSSLHSEIVLYSILFYVPLPCDTQNLANATAVCLSRGTVFDLNETLRSCRLAKNFGIKLGDCSTEHLAQVVVFILRFLKTCWDAFIVDSKIWRGHFPKSLWEWWLYANCEVSA